MAVCFQCGKELKKFSFKWSINELKEQMKTNSIPVEMGEKDRICGECKEKLCENEIKSVENNGNSIQRLDDEQSKEESGAMPAEEQEESGANFSFNQKTIKKKSRKWKIILALILIVGVPFIGYLNEKGNDDFDRDDMTYEELKELSIPWEYDDILRNESEYIDEVIEIKGTVKNEMDSISDVRTVWATHSCKPFPDNYDCKYFELWIKGDRVLEGDELSIMGTVKKVSQYQINAGFGTTKNTVAPTVRAYEIICTNCD